MSIIETNDVTVPSNPADRKKINDCLQEIVVHLERIDMEKECIKDILAVIKEEYAIPPKHARKLAKALHKQNYQEISSENESFELLYESIVGGIVAAADVE